VTYSRLLCQGHDASALMKQRADGYTVRLEFEGTHVHFHWSATSCERRRHSSIVGAI
jgi:hypothetical protein